MGGEKRLDSIFNLKFTSKQLVKSSIKCEKDEKAEKLKVTQPWRAALSHLGTRSERFFARLSSTASTSMLTCKDC